MVTCDRKPGSQKHLLISSGKCQRAAEMPRWGGTHLGGAAGAFQHYLRCLAGHQLCLQRLKRKHGAAGGNLALGVTDGREMIAPLKCGATFCAPIQQMGASSFVCHLEAVTAGIQARGEAETQIGRGAAICQRSPSFSTLRARPDCTLGNKTTSKKADRAQSFTKRQTLVAPRVVTIQQLLCLHPARTSFMNSLP